MTQTKSLHSGNDGALLSPREEAERFAVAADRLLERARQNPEVAAQFLRDIGYFDMMEQQRFEEQEETEMATNGSHANDSSNDLRIPISIESAESSTALFVEEIEVGKRVVQDYEADKRSISAPVGSSENSQR